VIDYIIKPTEIIPLSTLNRANETIRTATASTNNRLRKFLREPSRMEPASSGSFVSRYEIPISPCDENDYHLFSDKEMYSYTHRQEYKVKMNQSQNQSQSQSQNQNSDKDAATETEAGTGSGEPVFEETAENEPVSASMPKYCLKKSGSDQKVDTEAENTKGTSNASGASGGASGGLKIVSASTIKGCLPSVRARSKITTTDKAGRPRSWVFKFTNCFDSEEDVRRIEQIKAGPKKSSEWSIFKSSGKVTRQLTTDPDESSDSDSGGFAALRQS
jgi:hypothetical protein